MNKEEINKFLIALISAYVWVVRSDEDLTFSEFKNFEKALLSSAFISDVEISDLRAIYKDMVQVFDDNYEYGVQLTKSRLAKYKSNKIFSQEIARVAKMALVADHKLSDVENIVLINIAMELNLSSI